MSGIRHRFVETNGIRMHVTEAGAGPLKVAPPAVYVVADRDLVYHFPGMKDLVGNLRTFVPNLSRTLFLEGRGHWTQQERPVEVSRALVEFLRGLSTP